MKKRKRNNKGISYKIISLLLLIVTVIFIIILSYADILPIKYYKDVILILLVFDIFNIFLINLKKLKKRVKKFICLIIFISMLIMGIGSSYLYKTTEVLKGNGDSKYKVENYSIVVLKESKLSKLKDINNIGYYTNSNGSNDAIKKLNINKKFEFEPYNTSDILVSELINNNIESIMIEDSILNLIYEENEEFRDTTKVIYNFKIKVKTKNTLKEVDVTKKPFAVYISGIDTYGEISSVSRSDVNIVAIVNPRIKQLLLISIPRDYYVKLHGTNGPKDKLTHAGIYGVDMSIHTIEDLLDIDINYYAKVNFTSVIDIVDALGGLEVYSEYTFISFSGYSFKKGMNKVNGEQALDFARTRKAFTNGDRQRGINQQAVIEAAIRKATSKSIITKYTSLLKSVDGKYQTNMEYKKMTQLIKMQLNDMSPWNITSYSLSGSDSSNYTYTYNQLLYVMEPDENSISEAKNLIQKVLNDEKLDTSYENISGNSYNVYKTTSTNTQKNESNTAKNNQEKEKQIEDKNNDNKSDNKSDNNTNDNNTVENKIKDSDSTDKKNTDDEEKDSNANNDTTKEEEVLSDIIPSSNDENNSDDNNKITDE